MGAPISLDENLINKAKVQARVSHHSVPKQIEHWATIGHIAEDNPELNYSQIKDMLLGLEDHKSGNVKPYKCGSL